MISFRWRMLRSFESCHHIGSSKCFRVPGRMTTGNAMQVLADGGGACSGVDQSPVGFVSARGSERVGYTSSLLRISQFDMQGLRIWTITSNLDYHILRAAQVLREKEALFRRSFRNLQRAVCVSRHEPEPIPGLFSNQSGCPR